VATSNANDNIVDIAPFIAARECELARLAA
jgi:hypothetical protein